MPKDSTYLVHHALDEQEIQDLCTAIEIYLRTLGIREPNVDVMVSEDDPPEKRDNGRPNEPHLFSVDHETGMCIICGWGRVCHNFPEVSE